MSFRFLPNFRLLLSPKSASSMTFLRLRRNRLSISSPLPLPLCLFRLPGPERAPEALHIGYHSHSIHNTTPWHCSAFVICCARHLSSIVEVRPQQLWTIAAQAREPSGSPVIQRATALPEAVSVPAAAASPAGGKSITDELRGLAELKAQGILTNEEFVVAKASVRAGFVRTEI